MTKEDHYYAVLRLGQGSYARLRGQPEEGFEDPSQVLSWLVDNNYTSRESDEWGEPYHPGWGTRYFASSGNDPWQVKQE